MITLENILQAIEDGICVAFPIVPLRAPPRQRWTVATMYNILRGEFERNLSADEVSADDPRARL